MSNGCEASCEIETFDKIKHITFKSSCLLGFMTSTQPTELTDKQIARLVGVAPINHDSG